MTIDTAQLDWQTDDLGGQTPISALFGDVYFSRKDGLSESDYVFIQHNNLPTRLQKIIDEGGYFVIGETGFGTGLNFLAVLCLWRHLKKQMPANSQSYARLHFISTEKYPLNHKDLQNALTAWQDAHLYGEPLAPLINELLACYPPCIEGCHRRHFDDVMLDVWFGDAYKSLSAIAQQHNHTHSPPFVDAWFLDGFAPSKNKQMWSDELFDVISKLSKNTTTLATFTAAGDVRRKLIARGANVQKVKGFGHKREMLTAYFAANNSSNPQTKPVGQTTIIIGAGVAGLCCAYALANKGFEVRILDKCSPLAGASGNPRALFSPKLGQNHNDLTLQSFLYARHFYQKLQNSAFNCTQLKIFESTGVTDFLLPNKKSDDKCRALIDGYPDSFVHQIDTSLQSFSAFLPDAGLISPHRLAGVILAHPNIQFISDTITHLQHSPSLNVMVKGKHADYHAHLAIVCAGFESHLVHSGIFDGRKIRGQVSVMDNNHPDYSALKSALSEFARTHTDFAIKYDGYACSFDECILMGASFVRNSTDTTVKNSEHAFNISKLKALFANTPEIDMTALQGRASIRSQTPDYHPIVGQISPFIYSLTALGSKGFCFAPFCAESLVGMILGEFLPIHIDLLQKISPKRVRLQTPINQNE